MVGVGGRAILSCHLWEDASSIPGSHHDLHATSLQVYNSLLDGCSRKQKPQKAMEYLQDMISTLVDLCGSRVLWTCAQCR